MPACGWNVCLVREAEGEPTIESPLASLFSRIPTARTGNVCRTVSSAPSHLLPSSRPLPAVHSIYGHTPLSEYPYLRFFTQARRHAHTQARAQYAEEKTAVPTASSTTTVEGEKAAVFQHRFLFTLVCASFLNAVSDLLLYSVFRFLRACVETGPSVIFTYPSLAPSLVARLLGSPPPPSLLLAPCRNDLSFFLVCVCV